MIILVLLVLCQVQVAKADLSRTITFKTAFGTSTLSDVITIPQDSLNKWQSLAHPSAVMQDSSGQYSIDFSQFVDARSVQSFSAQIASSAQFGEEDVADTVLSFVQGVGYVWNSYTFQYTLYPVETLATGGLCDDLSVLYASMMIALGFHVIFLWYPNITDLGGSPIAHVEVGVHLTAPPEHTRLGNYTYYTVNGMDYYVAETTSQGWLVGELPVSLQGQTNYYEVAPQPTTGYVIATASQSRTLTFQATLPAQTVQDYLPIFLLTIVGVWLVGYAIGKRSSGGRVQTFRTCRFCPHCGAQLTRDGKYCDRCRMIQN